jgi:hypothetical protein
MSDKPKISATGRPQRAGGLSVPMPMPLIGLGDLAAKITRALGIEECEGCKKRREAMNRAVSFGREADEAD